MLATGSPWKSQIYAHREMVCLFKTDVGQKHTPGEKECERAKEEELNKSKAKQSYTPREECGCPE